MILRPPSLSKPWDEYLSIDPTFVQPPQLADGASDEDREAFKRSVEEYVAKLKAARETGDWAPMLAPGKSLNEATKFTLLQIDRNLWREWLDRSTLPYEASTRIGPASLRALLVRAAVKAIPGCEVKIERRPDSKWAAEMAQPELIDYLDGNDPRIVGELGNRIIDRLRGLGPLS